MPTARIKVVFTIDGHVVGDPFIPPAGRDVLINDVHFQFTPGKTKPHFQFTRDGEPIGESKEAPDGTNDVGVEFGEDDEGKPRIKWMHWTKDGKPIGFEWAPPGADDFHLVLGKGGLITGAYWTFNGEKLKSGGDIKIPNYPVNDVHILPDKRRLRVSEGPSLPEDVFPPNIFEKARALIDSDIDPLAEAEKIKDDLAHVETIEDLFDLPVAADDAEGRQVFILALLLALFQAASERDCDCARELAALRDAQARLQGAANALQQAQNNLAAAQGRLATARARERAAWRAYDAASRLVQRVCSGIGRFDPLCLVAITYETLLGNKWRIRFQELQAAQDAVQDAQRLVGIAEQDLQQALQRFAQALADYIRCLLRCLFGF